MAVTRNPASAPPGGPPAKLSRRELEGAAGRHLADLADSGWRASQHDALLWARTRRVWRAIVLGWLSVWETFGEAWRWLADPRRLLGRLARRWRLWMPSKTFGLWTLLLVAALVVLAYFRFGPLEEGAPTVRLFGVFTVEVAKSTEPWKTISGALLTTVLIALLVLLWNDLIRLPYLGRKVRRQVIGQPERVLMADLLARQGRPLVERIALDIVPRTELYADLLPGVLARDRKDVQVLVGDAGGGKTTALLAVAQLLARYGIVPVLVPLRSHMETTLIEPAQERFEQQVQALVRSRQEGELLWRWLVLRKRVSVLVDDIDQVGPDGERGFVMRKMLDEAAESGLSVIVTARPAGVPAGIAASAIELGALERRAAIEHVIKRAKHDRSFKEGSRISQRRIEEWVDEGALAQAPFYLELLASLAAVGQCARLPQAGSLAGKSGEAGRVSRTPAGEWAWNPLWVRFRVLEHYHEQMKLGRVRRSLGIEPRERRSTLRALEQAALGTLVASSLAARMKLAPQSIEDEPARYASPLRNTITDFIGTDDRADLHALGNPERGAGNGFRPGSERRNVSAHEVIDAGERLALLEPRSQEDRVTFHHRIMQAYLAARCLVEHEHGVAARQGQGQGQGQAQGQARERENPTDRLPASERDWIEALLDAAHPEKLTAHMTLKFAAMRAREIAEAQAARQGNDERETDERGIRDAQRGHGEDAKRWERIGKRIVGSLVEEATAARDGRQDDGRRAGTKMTKLQLTAREGEAGPEQLTLEVALGQGADSPPAEELEPLYKPDPERRADPDDALMKLTTAAEIARAVPTSLREKTDDKQERYATVEEILREIEMTPGPTRWTKLSAIQALAVSASRNTRDAFGEDASGHPKGTERWRRIWEFARDTDYEVRRTACEALEENAYESFKVLAEDIEWLIDCAAARSAYGRWLVRPEQHDGIHEDGRRAGGHGASAADALDMGALLERLTREEGDVHYYDITTWDVDDGVEALKALGAILPAMVSGFREDPSIELESALLEQRAEQEERKMVDVMCHRPEHHPDRIDYARRARRALESLVALAFEGRHGDLESAVAQGFRSDALRHAQSPEHNVTGPGWVNPNRAMVAGQCLDRATFWYARLALYQALAMYAVAGADAQDTLDVFARHLRRGVEEKHPFTRRAAALARAAVRRSELRSDRWLAYVWGDEGKEAAGRARQLKPTAAQLLADVMVLLNLNQGSQEDRQDAFVQMQVLPYCLSGSRDRSEILGEGCPSRCGWNLCPYRQPPPDEPDARRGVRRSFCRQQREIARHRKPPWQPSLHKRKLKEFWREMEMRART